MRRVMVMKMVLGKETNKYAPEDDYEASFHGWGTDYGEYEIGPGHYTCAVIEKDDGTVQLVYAEMIRFLTPTPQTRAGGGS